MSKNIRKAAGFVVYRKNTNDIIEYLLMQASYEPFHWTPPKGHLENGESNMDAAIRETQEEAGIKVNDLSIDHNFEKVLKYEPKGKPFIKQVTYWLACLLNSNTPVILSNEHQGYEWLPLIQAKEKAVYPEMHELLNECENYLIKTNVQ